MLQRHDDAATYWQRGGSRLRTKMQVISNCSNRHTLASRHVRRVQYGQ